MLDQGLSMSNKNRFNNITLKKRMYRIHRSVILKCTNKHDNSTIIPGQGDALQDFRPVPRPMQYTPPYWGTGDVHVRVRVAWPSPHVTSHPPHAPHEPQFPSTENGFMYIVHSDTKSYYNYFCCCFYSSRTIQNK